VRASPELPTDLLTRGRGERLVAVWQDGSVSLSLPPEGALVLGRGDDCDIVLQHTSVSRAHAKLHLGATPRIEDLGSSNGTWIEGKRLSPNTPTPFRHGALIEVGAVLVVVHGPEESATPGPPPDAVVADDVMVEVYEMLEVVAKSPLSVVLMGETGVGKEVLASRIHARSPRAAHTFVKINCAALVESLLEAELFGYERGAFTGANQAKPGLLESASGGTLFLDEIGELPLATQAKLLRVLESGEVMRVGSLRPRAVDVRFVSATNRDLRDLVRQGTFREDLFFRLDGVSIYVPPLRERKKEIALLVARFTAEAARQHGRSVTVSPEAIAALTEHTWPGNVRELRNVIARSVLLARGSVLMPSDLRFEPVNSRTVALGGQSAPPAPAPPPPEPRSELDPAETERVLAALRQCGGNQTRAAKLLGISRRTLLHRLDSINAPRPRKS
jgi:two-component system, NtrC family, response regulator AtoC